MGKKNIFKKIKDWIVGKDSKVKEANRVTNYGGGASSKSVQKEVKRSIVKAEAKRRGEKQTAYQKSAVSKSSNSAFKAMPPSAKKAEAKDKKTSKKSDPFNAKNAFKASAQPKFTHQSTALGTMSKRDIDTRTAKMNAYNENRKYQSRAADKLKPLIDEKYSGDTLESKQRIKSGEYWSDPNVMKYDVLKHPIANSLARGALSGTTFGLSELGIALLPQSKEVEEAERLYQANKSKGAEFAGEMAGSLLGFGLTSGASKTAVTKLAPKTTARLGESATEYLAKNGLVRRAAEKEALRKLGTTATKEEIEHFARSKAAKLVAALGEDAAVNLTTSAVADVAQAVVDSDNPAEFLKNLGINVGMDWALGGVTGAVPAFRGSNVDDAFVRNRLAAREGLDDLARRNRIGMGRPSDLTLPKLNAVPDAADAVARYPAIEDAYLDYDGTIEAVNRYYNPDDTAEAAVDRYHDLDIQRAKPKTETKVEPPKTKTLKDRIADADDFDEFVKANAKDAEAKEYVKANKMSGLKGLWHEQRIAKHKKGIHKISIEEANEATRKAIPENVLDGWFRSANSGYKPRLMDAIAKDPDAINAGMNVAYHNYVNANPESPLPFDEWLNTPQKMYRGTHGQDTIDEDVFSAFTPDRKVAEKHAGRSGNARIEEIEVKPIDTLGSYQTTVEQEYLVPKSVVEANAPKAEAPTAEVAAEPPKTKSKKKKTPPTREERLANSNGIDQYNARAEHQAQRFEEGYEKADNVRAVLGGEEPKAPAKGTKPAAENLKTKAQAEPKDINLDDAVNKKREKTTFREKFHKVKASVQTAISDSLNAFEKANKQYVRSDNARWRANNAAIDKTRRAGAIAGRSIGEGQVSWKNGKITGTRKVVINGEEHTLENGKSLKAIFDGMDEATEKDFNKYLLLKHEPSRIEAGKPIFAGSQYNSKEACEKAAQELLKKNPEFAVKAEEIYNYTRNELQNRVDAGLIKQETVDEWRKKYPFYVPTGREGDFSGEYDIWDLASQLKNDGNTVGAGEIKKTVGGDQPIRSIKEQLAEATNRNWRDMSLNNLFRNMFGDKIGKELAVYADGGLEKVLDNTINLSKSKDGGKYFAEVFENGDKHRVEIEKPFYDALNDLYKNGRFGDGHGGLGDGLDLLNEAASIPAGAFKNLVTSWNPIFMVKNGLRDFPEAIINSRQTKEFLQVWHSGQALAELSNNGEFLQALRDSGVSQANLVNLEEALTKGDNIFKKGVNKFTTLQEAVETYPRLIEYMATIKKEMGKGYDLADGLKNVPMEIRDIAAANAADVTVNFGRSGSVGKALNKGIVPFFNPSVQGWSKFVRNFTEQSGWKPLASTVIKAAALGAGATAINNYLWGDNPNYQRISARDKATNYIFPVPSVKYADEEGIPDNVPLLPLRESVDYNSTDTFIKIPKSRFAAEYSLPTVNAFNKNKMDYAEMLKVTKDQVFVVDPSENNLLSPLLDTTKSKEGETWYGTPIVPQALVDLPKSEQTDVNTSKISTAIGKASAKVQKKLHLPEEAQISPKKLDYIIDSETGVIGDFLLPATTPSKQGNGGKFNKYVKYPMGNVVKKSFTIDSVTQNDLSSRFYDQMGKIETKSKSSTASKADADEYKRYNGFSTEVSKVNKAIKALQGSKRETKLEDVRGMQKLRNQLWQDALDGKEAPSSNKTMNDVQKYVGTTYAIKNFGSSTDQTAMRKYGEKKYGDISNKEMRKAIDADKGFFKGVKSIGNLEARIEKAGTTSNTALTKAVALAGANADDDLFGAYGAIYKSRTESANKMTRARNYFKEGGSEKEYTKLEVARRTLGKLSADDEAKALNKLDKQFAKGELTWEERDNQEKSIKYNANLSYIGLAASLAQANAPARGYRLYDIKDKNIQKGINLAAMGFTARDYKEMSKALDTNGNGYPSKQEIVDYVSKSNVKDKATLFDALYYYQGKSNPFGTPTKYTREQAALMGKKNGVKAISGESEEFELNPEEPSGSNWRGGYYRGRWHRWGGGHSRKGRQPIGANNSAFKAKKANISGGSKVSAPNLSGGINTKSTASRVSSSPKINITPLGIKTVKPVKASRGSNNLAAALEDIQTTEKKVKPPKARR